MKLIPRRDHDDFGTLTSLANNPRLGSYPDLKQCQAMIEVEYAHYCQVRGNVLELNRSVDLPAALAGHIVKHYSGNIEALKFIKAIRKSLSPRVCPMCGSPKTGQVDHIAPKDEYPEFSLFSHNLVPACDCNGLKGTTFRDIATGARVLHPYYDAVLQERLVYLSFQRKRDTPDIELQLVVGKSNNKNVEYHVNNILRKTNVIEFAIQLWAQLKDDPQSLLFVNADDGIILEEHVKLSIEKLLDMKDREFGTPNNWFSMFYWGILTSAQGWAVKYITRRINDIGPVR